MNDEKWYMEGEMGEWYRKALASMQNTNRHNNITLSKKSIDESKDLSDWELENGIQIYEDNGEFVLNSFDTIIKSEEKDVQNASPESIDKHPKKRSRKHRTSHSSSRQSNCLSERLKGHKHKRRKQSHRSSLVVSDDDRTIRNRTSDQSPEVHSYRRCDREKPPERSAEYIKSLVKRREQC